MVQQPIMYQPEVHFRQFFSEEFHFLQEVIRLNMVKHYRVFYLLNTKMNPIRIKRYCFNDCWFRCWKYAKMEKKFFECQYELYQFAPYQAVIPQNVDWKNPYQSLGGEAVYQKI